MNGIGATRPLTDRDHARIAGQARLLDPTVVHDLAMRAIDTAKSAGATYAEVRISRTVSQTYRPLLAGDSETVGIGVRALCGNGWGFAASPYQDLDESVTLARVAVAQAKINARIAAETIQWGTYPVARGTWSTPIRIDPFAIPIEEKCDFLISLGDLTPRHVHRKLETTVSAFVERKEQTVATTEGAYFSQIFHSGWMDVKPTSVEFDGLYATGRRWSSQATGIDSAGGGWERFLDAKIRDQMPRMLAECEELLPWSDRVKPLENGRYDVVGDAATMAGLVAATFGNATQLDRALGYEANAEGTSYLGPDPFKFLGTPLGSSLLNVTADRSMPQGLATAKWDDEGVEPETFPLIERGTLVDYQTTREQAPWLAPWYQQHGRAVRSHGCAVAKSALDAPVQGTPNLSMLPGSSNVTFAELVANTKKGVAMLGCGTSTDFQSRHGFVSGLMREIANGKLGAILGDGAVSFDSTAIWKSLRALGGASGQTLVPYGGGKGQPYQTFDYTVSAVPAALANVVIVRGAH
jgi:TldD protein